MPQLWQLLFSWLGGISTLSGAIALVITHFSHAQEC